ncbi:MAG: hypothetical protein N3H84_05000 [Candidatus Caldarchaeum sp.]|nr:hypothetical protein [Candidatus Caldarchaeum sp.]MCX8201443.1 hypothetical protein [Candidatus Caldarchaeum sp.]MDW8435859.1 hypothetical protein [Candidatus Caldarchaeum sp.]
MKRVVFLVSGVVLAVVGVALSWRLLVELVGLLLIAAGLFMVFTALAKR